MVIFRNIEASVMENVEFPLCIVNRALVFKRIEKGIFECYNISVVRD